MDDENIRDLFADVVIKAIEDWRDCIKDEIDELTKGEDYVPLLPYGVSYMELRRFFRSEYCAGICEALNYDSDALLSQLENERAFALQRVMQVPA